MKKDLNTEFEFITPKWAIRILNPHKKSMDFFYYISWIFWIFRIFPNFFGDFFLDFSWIFLNFSDFPKFFFGARRFYKWKRIQTLNLKIWNPQKKILGFFGFFLGSVRGFLWVNNPSGISSLHTTRPVFRPTSPGRRGPVEKWWPSAD